MVARVEAAKKDGDTLGGSSRSSPTTCRRAWARTSSGTGNSTHVLEAAIDEHPGDQRNVEIGGQVQLTADAPFGFGGARRDVSATRPG